jgi:hypothetical protein
MFSRPGSADVKDAKSPFHHKDEKGFRGTTLFGSRPTG